MGFQSPPPEHPHANRLPASDGWFSARRVLPIQVITDAGLILRRIDLLFRGSKRYFYPLARKVCPVASSFIAQWTKICAMTPASATTNVFPVRKIKPAPVTFLDRTKTTRIVDR